MAALAVLLAAAVFSSPETAGAIVGRVVDEIGDPLAAAFALVDGTESGAMTDSDGKYLIFGLPPGTYELRLLYEGFELSSLSVIEVCRGDTTVADFAGVRVDSLHSTPEMAFLRSLDSPEAWLAQDQRLPVLARGIGSL